MDDGLSLAYVQLGKVHWSHDGPSTQTVLHKKKDRERLNVPRDPCNCVYLALVLAGAGFLLPYNSFIIAVDYFQARYPNTTIVFDMSLVYILMAFFAVTINNFLVETLSLHVRISFGYILAFFTLLFVAFFEIWFEAFDESISYNINLIAVAVVACGCTVQQSSFYGYTSMLPARYTQAVMTGESAAGLITSINRIITKLLLDDERINTIIFFCISIISLLFCFVIHFVVRKTEFVKFYVESCGEANQSEDMRNITLDPCEVDILEAAGDGNKHESYGILSRRSSTSGAPQTDSAFQSVENVWADSSAIQGFDIYVETSCVGSDNERTQTGQLEGATTRPVYKVRDEISRIKTRTKIRTGTLWSGVKRGVLARWDTSKLIWPYMVSIGTAYFVTLCLFPGIESEVTSCSFHSWMPVMLMAIFNLFDFIGKILASFSYDWTRKKLVLWSLARIILLPLLVMCATPRKEPLIPGEGWSMLFSLMLGLSNGVLGSVPMIVAPSRVPNEHKEISGNIMMLSYSIGLTAGSGISYALDAILGPHVPDLCNEHVLLTTPASIWWNATSAINATSI